MRKTPPEEQVAAVLVIVMVVLVGFQVLSRYILHFSLSYTEEIVRYLFVWTTFLGIAGAVRGNRHLSISSAPEQVGGILRKAVRILIGVGALGFAGVLLYYGTRIVLLQMTTGQKTAALGFPMWIVGIAVPLGAALVIVRIICGSFWKGAAHDD